MYIIFIVVVDKNIKIWGRVLVNWYYREGRGREVERSDCFFFICWGIVLIL